VSAPQVARPDARTGASPRASVHLALLGTQSGFALFPVLAKIAFPTIPPLVLSALRVVSAALILELMRRLARDRELEPKDRPAVFLYALLGVSFNQLLYILGLSWTTAINTSILCATIPVFTLAVSVLLRHERLDARGLAGVLLAMAGVLVLLDVTRFDLSSRHLRGDLLIVANSLSYSFYLVLSRRALARYSARTFVSRIFAYGSIVIVLVATPALARFRPTAVDRVAWWSFGAIIVFGTVLPYLWNSWALARIAASKVAFYVFVQPLIASVLAVIVLHESIGPRTAAAATLIFGGLAVTMAPGRPGGAS
jgi:drug/metabolite transporter (DMT)-like permease